MNYPPEISRNYVELGIKKVKLPYLKMFILGVYAGFFIGSGGVCASVCSYLMSGGDSRFYSGLVFPIGLMLVLCAGAELFTGNCLLIIPLFCQKITIVEMLICWLIVFFGNLVGAIIMAFLVVYGHVTHLFSNGLAHAFVNTATTKSNLSFEDAFVRGILCNFFVCLSVWLSIGAQDFFSKMAALWTPILLFIACGFEDVVSNMFYIPAGLFSSYEYDIPRPKLNWGRFIYKNLIPVTLGNICGGVVLVGIGYWYIYLTPDYSFLKKSPPPNNIPPTEAVPVIK